MPEAGSMTAGVTAGAESMAGMDVEPPPCPEGQERIDGACVPTGLEGTLGLTFYAPNVNLLRDGRWGRAEEVPSEDPCVNSR